MTLSMTCEQFETILPDLLDDDAAAMTHAVRGHLEACGECRSLYEDLTSIRATAAALPPIVPSRDLWAGIAARIETPVVPLVEGLAIPKQRRRIDLRTASIAAALLVLVNGAVSYTLMSREAPTVVQPDTAFIPAPSAMRTAVHQETMMVPLPVPVAPVSAPARRSAFVLATNAADQGPDETQQPGRRREAAKVVYDREITRLRAIVDSGRHKLDPATVALLDRNLRIIDVAIEQCTEALAKDSSSTFLIESLNNAYQTKVKLLRLAAAAASRG
jgi:hypothetical protein